ncbi:MAG: DUF1552 domain-containing protein [Planctomycetota bacterium]|nr:DUF1552 domain-containing protein [Planctomycetota bacterium]
MTNRRNFIKGAGVTLTLPWLETFNQLQAADAESEPRRLLLICVPLGIYREAFIPKETGSEYKATEYLSVIDEFRDQYTVISGLDHPGVNGGHSSEARIFTGVPSNKRNVRSLDQYLAGHIGQHTRFDAMPLSAGHSIFSWTDGGTMVPAESKMAKVYARMFVGENESDRKKVLQNIGHDKSIMDLVQEQAKALKPKISTADQNKLEEYFESIRETERRLVKSESWVHKPKPQVNADSPKDPANEAELITQLRNVCDMTYLAFKTDSTRIITFGYFQQNKVNIPGVSNGYHGLSHHGQDPNNITQLRLVELELFKQFKTLLTNLKNSKEGDATLLDRTTIVITSNLGNGSNHSNKDLPVLLAGGRFKHGRHLSFEPSSVPLSNLYLSILNQFGLEDSSFATSTGTLKGLETKG